MKWNEVYRGARAPIHVSHGIPLRRITAFFLACTLVGAFFIAAPFSGARADEGSGSTTELTDDFLTTDVGTALEQQTSQKALWVGQKVTPNADGRSATVTQSIYTCGGVGDGEAVPTDLVFVLDVSQSMGSNLANLVKGVNSLISNIQEQSSGQEAVKNRVSVVLFSGLGSVGTNDQVSPTMTYPFEVHTSLPALDDDSSAFVDMTDSSAVGNLESALTNLNLAPGYSSAQSLLDAELQRNPQRDKYFAPGGSTQTGDGMKQAYDVLKTQGNEDNAKQVILFTDGVPGNNDWTVTSGANNINASYQSTEAIKYANIMAQDFSATIYSAGFFSSEDATKDTQWWNEQTGWKTKTLPQASGSQDSDLTKRFLEFVSSNVSFPEADLGDDVAAALMNTTDWTLDVDDSSSGYVRFATKADELESMFSNMIPKVDKAGVALDAKATVNELVAAGFDVARNESGADDSSAVKVYEESATDPGSTSQSPTFTNKFVELAPNSADSSGTAASVSVEPVEGTETTDAGYRVSGWDFAANYIGQHTDGTQASGSAATTTETQGSAKSGDETDDGTEDAFYGKRLVIQYSVQAQDTTEGVDVPINDVSKGATETGITEGKIAAVFPAISMDVAPQSNAEVADCDPDTLASEGLCLSRNVIANADGRSARVILSAYATGGTDGLTSSAITESSRLVDVALSYFTLGDLGSVKVWEQSVTGFGSTDDSADNSSATAPQFFTSREELSLGNDYALNSVSDTGDEGLEIVLTPGSTDLATNYVGARADDTANLGKRIIVEYTITAKSDFLGGKTVQTNLESRTGATVGDESGDGTEQASDASDYRYAGNFPQATVDMALQKFAVSGNDAKAHLGGTYDSHLLIRFASSGAPITFAKAADGMAMNDYVDLQYAIVVIGQGFCTWDLKAGDESATVQSFGDDISVGNADVSVHLTNGLMYYKGEEPDLSAATSLDDATFTVHTLHPQISTKNSSVMFGQMNSLSANVTGWQWETSPELENMALVSDVVTG